MQNKMVNKYKEVIIAIIVFAILLTLYANCRTKSLYTEPDSTYKVVTDVPGISFSIPLSVTQATAINKITPEMEFDPGTTYSYKDGNDTFLVFNMDNIVILCERGTAFDFDMIPKGDDKGAGLKNSPIVSTWLSQSGKTFSYDEGLNNGVYKLIGDVKAQVSITTRVFGDFTGKLAVVTDGVTEYALFIGAPDEIYEQLGSDAEKIISTVAKSLKMTYGQTGNSALRRVGTNAVFAFSLSHELCEIPFPVSVCSMRFLFFGGRITRTVVRHDNHHLFYFSGL